MRVPGPAAEEGVSVAPLQRRLAPSRPTETPITKSTWSLFALILLAAATTTAAQLEQQTARESLVESAVWDELAASTDGRVYVIVMLESVPMRLRSQLIGQQMEVSGR